MLGKKPTLWNFSLEDVEWNCELNKLFSEKKSGILDCQNASGEKWLDGMPSGQSWMHRTFSILTIPAMVIAKFLNYLIGGIARNVFAPTTSLTASNIIKIMLLNCKGLIAAFYFLTVPLSRVILSLISSARMFSMTDS